MVFNNAGVRKWFVLASILGGLFLVCSLVYATGIFNVVTLRVEQWLLLRPETRFDCMFYEWRNLGEVPASIVLTLVLGIVCALKGYRRRVLPYLLLLLLLGIGIEAAGKTVIGLSMPTTLRSGLTDLECPQLNGQPQATKLAVAVGFLNLVAAPTNNQISWSQTVSQMPLDMQRSEREYSYPGGHAARWSFVWLLAAWLAWRYLRLRLLRVPVTALLFLWAFVGGFLQFYIGVHMLSDTIAGYLLGGALACCGISVLLLNDTRRKTAARSSLDAPTMQKHTREKTLQVLRPLGGNDELDPKSQNSQKGEQERGSFFVELGKKTNNAKIRRNKPC